jgi:hypothetical protein
MQPSVTSKLIVNTVVSTTSFSIDVVDSYPENPEDGDLVYALQADGTYKLSYYNVEEWK